MNTNLKQEEQVMLESLNRNLYSLEFIAMLKDNWEKYHNLHFLGDIIGEAYIFHILFKDGEGFLEYMRKINGVYDEFRGKMRNPNLSENERNEIKYRFEYERAAIIEAAIARKFDIDIDNCSKEESLKIKEYFLREFVEKGYVSHAFPDAYTESIVEKGLVASSASRGSGNDDKTEIQLMFMEHGIITPLGAYPFYGGSGVYYEKDFRNVFHHAVESPEWFKWFTSSDHRTTYQPNIVNSPYVLRDEEMCRRNVLDLCANAGMNQEETSHVMSFYNKYYQLYSSPQLRVALIPKSVIGKSDVSVLGLEDKSTVNSIVSVLTDEKKQYVEHIGNVSHVDIPPESIVFTSIPSAEHYITPPQEYARESRESITDRRANLEMIQYIQSNERLVDGMKEPLEVARGRIINSGEQTIDSAPVQPEENFAQRSVEDVQIADAIRKENEEIAKKKTEAKNMDKPYVYTMKQDNRKGSGNGFVSSLLVSIMIGMVVAMLLMVMFLIIM